MEIIICDECDKEIEGYNKKQLEYLLAQHKLAKHKKEETNEIVEKKE